MEMLKKEKDYVLSAKIKKEIILMMFYNIQVRNNKIIPEAATFQPLDFNHKQEIMIEEGKVTYSIYR